MDRADVLVPGVRLEGKRKEASAEGKLMTEQQIRETIARMEQETPVEYRRPKTKLLKLALAGDPGARFVVYSNGLRYGTVEDAR